MSNPIAPGMRRILEMRAGGNRPADPVIVSLLSERLDLGNPIVAARHDQRYDWTGLIGLDVTVMTDGAVPAGQILNDIMRAREPLPDVGEVHLFDQVEQKGFRVRMKTTSTVVEVMQGRVYREVVLWPWTEIEYREAGVERHS